MEEFAHVEPIKKMVSMDQRRDADRVWLSIEGMSCPDCAIRVRNGLISLEGVYAADVYLGMALAEVFYDSRKVSTNIIQSAVQRAGNQRGVRFHGVVIATEG